MRSTPAPVLAVLLLAGVASAAEPRDLGTHCTPTERKKVERWLVEARTWTALAKKRVDEGDANTKLTGEAVFGEKQYDAKRVSEKLGEIAKVLARPEIRCAAKDLAEYYYCDDQGGKVAAWEAFTDVDSKVIWLCPKMLGKTGAKNDLAAIGRLVHEASHASGVGEIKFEAYCTAGFSCEKPCGDGEHAYKTADNWAQLVHCASDHESNEEGFEIVVKRPKKR